MSFPCIDLPDHSRGPANCLVCGSTLIPNPMNTSPVCGRSDCRQVFAQKERMLPAAFDRYLRFRSERIRASIEREKAQAKLQRTLQEKESEENRAFWKAKLKKLPPVLSGDDYPLVAIPSCTRKIVNLPEKRRRSFRDHLNRLLSKATAKKLREPPQKTEKIDPEPGDSTLKRIIIQSCTICAGGCCTRGGDHAYLSEDTLLRVMNNQPALRPRHVLDAYLDRIGNKTYADSCIFHTSQGCSLPENLRSDTCLSYFCPGLEHFSTAFKGPEKPRGAFVIVRSREPWDNLSDKTNSIDRCYVLEADGSAESVD